MASVPLSFQASSAALSSAPAARSPVTFWRMQAILAAERQRAAQQAATAAPAPVRHGRIPPGQQLYGRLYALRPRADGTYDLQVVGYIVPGGVFAVGAPQVLNVHTGQPGAFELQFLQMYPVQYGPASGWMPASAFEFVS